MDPQALARRSIESLPKVSAAAQLRHLHICRIGLSSFASHPPFLLYRDEARPLLRMLLSVHESEEMRILHLAIAVAHALPFSPESISRYYFSGTEMARWAAEQGLPKEAVGEFVSSFGGQWLERHYDEIRSILPHEMEQHLVLIE